MNIFVEFFRDERGASAIEYGLVAALISVAAAFAFQSYGVSLSNLYLSVAAALEQAGAGG